MLWVGDELSGLVDWKWACIGARSIDPAHCRLNLFHYNPGMVDEIRTLWEQRSGLKFDPWAYIVSIIGTLDDIRARWRASGPMWAVEQVLQDAVADLG